MAFKSIEWECQRRFLPFNGEVQVSPHQTKKWACSLSAAYWPDAENLGLNLITDNRSFSTLKSNIRDLPELGMARSLPLGNTPPRGKAAEGEEAGKYAEIFRNVL